MTTNVLWRKIEPERVSATLEEALGKIGASEPEVVLDFSSVSRVDASALALLERIAAQAEQAPVKIVLCGVSVDIYKVLKLRKLAPRFSFLK